MSVKWLLKTTAAAAVAGAVVIGGAAAPASAGRRLPPKVVGITAPASVTEAGAEGSAEELGGCLDKAEAVDAEASI